MHLQQSHSPSHLLQAKWEQCSPPKIQQGIPCPSAGTRAFHQIWVCQLVILLDLIPLSIPRILSFHLAYVDKFECNLALPSATKPVQEKGMLRPQIIKKILSHLCENIFSSGKDIGLRQAAS